MHRASRFLISCIAGACFVPLSIDSARASDSGTDASADDASLALEASVVLDAAADAAPACIAVGQPCTTHETCCNESAYCGSFGGAGGALACGIDNPNELSTGSCGVTAPGRGDGLGVLAMLGLVVCVSVHRKRRVQ